MSREITTTNPEAQPSTALADNPQVEAIIRNRVVFRAEHGSFELDRELTPPERGHLQARKAEISRHLRPLGTASEEKRRLALALGSLFLGYPQLRSDNAAAERITAYIDALSGFPIAAALQAVEDVKTGKVDDLDPDYPPTSVRMGEIASKYVRKVRRERTEVEAVLAAKVGEPDVPDDVRKARAEELLAYSAKIRAEADADRIDRVGEFNAVVADKTREYIAAEWRRHGLEPRSCSLSLARKNDPDLDFKCTQRERGSRP